MEILKEGEKPEDRVAEFTCQNCKAELRAKRSEGEIISHTRNDDYVMFSCPCCTGTIHVDLKLFS